jgi:hypothetical protein
MNENGAPMRKRVTCLTPLLTAVILLAVYTHPGGAETLFKFPERITFITVKDEIRRGVNCQFDYMVETGKKKHHRALSFLKLTNFQGFGLTPLDTLATHVFNDNLSLALASVTKGKEWKSQTTFTEKMDFNGKKKPSFNYEEKKAFKNKKYQVKISHKFRNVSFMSLFLIASKIAASGDTKYQEKFNLIDGRASTIVTLKYKSNQTVAFKGETIPAVLLSVIFNKNKTWLFSIYKDKKGYYFPGNIRLSDRWGNSFELKADVVKHPVFLKPVKPALVPGISITSLDEKRQMPGANFIFLEPTNHRAMQSGEMARLINQAVLKGMNRARPAGKQLVITREAYQLTNDKTKINELAHYFFDSHEDNLKKTNQIVRRMMTPGHIKILVTGFYLGSGSGPIRVSPIVIFDYNKEFLTRNLQFTREELVYQDPVTKKTILRKAAADQIADTVRGLIELY